MLPILGFQMTDQSSEHLRDFLVLVRNSHPLGFVDVTTIDRDRRLRSRLATRSDDDPN